MGDIAWPTDAYEAERNTTQNQRKIKEKSRERRAATARPGMTQKTVIIPMKNRLMCTVN